MSNIYYLIIIVASLPVIIFVITVGIVLCPVYFLIYLSACLGYLVIWILKNVVAHFSNMATIADIDMGSKESFKIYQKYENGSSMNSTISTQSKFDKVRDKIEQQLNRQNKDAGIVKLKFPVEELDDLSIREKIYNIFNAERIGLNLFIKFNGYEKELIHRKLANSLENQNRNWGTNHDTICVVGNRDFRPDVGVWFQQPTRSQRRMPIVHRCPPPDVWIEVFYDISSDRNYAFNKIDWLQQNTTGIEFVAIVLPCLGPNPFHSNPNPGTNTTHATSQPACPTSAPYVCHWDSNNNKIWYQMGWNHYITLRCGLAIDFIVVLNELI